MAKQEIEAEELDQFSGGFASDDKNLLTVKLKRNMRKNRRRHRPVFSVECSADEAGSEELDGNR